jgi:hypothetical protein
MCRKSRAQRRRKRFIQMDGSRCDGTKKKLNFHEPYERIIKCFLKGMKVEGEE